MGRGHMTLLKSIYKVEGRLNTSEEKHAEVRCYVLPPSHVNDQHCQVTYKEYSVVNFIGHWLFL